MSKRVDTSRVGYPWFPVWKPAVESLTVFGIALATLFSFAFTATLFIAQTAGAQTAGAQTAGAEAKGTTSGDAWYGVEEMTVTGSIGTSLFKGQTMSVTAFDAQDIQAYAISDIADVGKFTPNLEIRTAGSTTPILFIRGVGLNDFTSNASGSVAVYIDGVALNLPGFQGAQLFDVENIDVLKGPQGSGPGRNASAGAIHVRTVKPNGEFDAFMNLSVGNFGFLQAEGGVGMPILDDVLAARFSFQFEQRDGLVRNRCAGFSQAEIDAGNVCGETGGIEISPSLDDEFNDVFRWAVRGQLRFQPELSFDSSWLLNIHASRVDQQPTVGQPVGAAESTFSSLTNNGYKIPEIEAERAAILAENFIREGVPNVPPFRCRRIPGCTEARA
ncbi:MAG: TonB-dependent receptor plug domain-containing protein, partial [Myxococcota bacterium]